MKQDLLIELGTEELPPKALNKLSNAFHQHFIEGLQQQELSFSASYKFATPRRLAILVESLDTQQKDKTIQRKGPALKAAFDDQGNPSKAAQGFAKSCGVEVAELDKLETEKGSWLVYNATEKGQPATHLIPDLINQALAKLPIPKRMTWGASREAFVRPVHWLVVLFGEQVIPCSILGLHAGSESCGHRFHSPAPFTITSPQDYQTLLREHYVVADFDTRKQQIREGVITLASQTCGHASIDENLLEEVTGLVEWPVPLMGNFDKEFLEVPQEALISAMQEHQKYFPVLDQNGKILPHFITVSNIESADSDKVVQGNERVIRPRLSDARFFFQTDQKKTLEQHNEPLAKVVFESQLGTVLEKSQRVSELARFIASQIGSDQELAARAGILSKADLSTEMVGEFPELQGIMGTYYARLSGEPEEVCLALNEQYQPRFSGDALPATDTGAAVSIADKIDTLVGILGIGKHPTGDKDPYALRRAAIGLIRIIIGKSYTIDLIELFDKAKSLYGEKLTNPKLKTDYLDFIQGRYQALFNEEGVTTDIIRAVLAVNTTQPLDFAQRVQAVKAFKKLPEAQALAAANKRVSNILSKSDTGSISETVDASKLLESEEKALYEAIHSLKATVEDSTTDYTEKLKALAELRQPVDKFFDKVMVNVDDTQIRNNRLALLSSLHKLFIGIADIAQLQS